jgi:hypothetical protein
MFKPDKHAMTHQATASLVRPSSGSRSGIVGIVRPVLARCAPRSPSVGMCGRQRQEAWPPRSATSQAVRLRHCIRRVSRQTVQASTKARASAVSLPWLSSSRLKMASLPTLRAPVRASRTSSTVRCGMAFASACCLSCSERVISVLHRRAPLPFQCSGYRAIGPILSTPILGEK